MVGPRGLRTGRGEPRAGEERALPASLVVTNLFNYVCDSRSTAVEASFSTAIMETSLADVRRFRRHSGSCIAWGDRLFISGSFDFDRLATKDQYLIAKARNLSVSIFQRLSLENGLALGLAQVVLTTLSYLVHRASSTRLDAVTLLYSQYQPPTQDTAIFAHTLTLRFRQGLQESCGRLDFSRAGAVGGGAGGGS